ncbi:uncharacterized protein LOC129600270 isoform X2 [Paramacrobiotus metropolitanus]|uniref:uncharacterized protein LOC129600270 isoform X2 n=1 Tax=Paramacrobiotus metropolitanus TaxID=2943436 RepID=UPI002445721C|nr:uncharacterized protein LOC129600270 isoform X2 [Paramacrobiotus metropolitanus]
MNAHAAETKTQRYWRFFVPRMEKPQRCSAFPLALESPFRRTVVGSRATPVLLCCNPPTVRDALLELRGAAAEIGLELNTKKCELYIDGGSANERAEVVRMFMDVAPDIRVVTPDKLELLGSSLLPEAVVGALMKKVGQAQVLADQLGTLPTHQALFLLKNYLSLPKLLYLLRTAECWQYPEALQKFDETIRTKAEQLTNVAMTDTVWEQAALPTKFGGLGLVKAADVALAAYASSLHGVADVVYSIVRSNSIREKCTRLTEVWTSRYTTEAPRTENRRFQSAWTAVQHTRTATRMVENADVITRARLLAASSSESRAWLAALSVSIFGNMLEDAHLRIAVARRLGAPVCQPHVCRCGSTVDSLGHHGLVCKLAKGRHGTHAVLNCNGGFLSHVLVCTSMCLVVPPLVFPVPVRAVLYI